VSTPEQWHPEPNGKPNLRLSLKVGLVGTALGIISATAAMTLLSRMWAACDVGINAAANSLGLLFFTAPIVMLFAAFGSALAFWAVARTARRWSQLVACVGAVLVALIVVWVDLAVEHNPGGDYPSPVCDENVPSWWPGWIPL
jgi:uncharacterized BrkB/YihY/UPF0761 family membrane protein